MPNCPVLANEVWLGGWTAWGITTGEREGGVVDGVAVGAQGTAAAGAAAGWGAARAARRAARRNAAAACRLAAGGRHAEVLVEAERISHASLRRSVRSCACTGPGTLVNHALRYCSGHAARERESALPLHSDGAGCRRL